MSQDQKNKSNAVKDVGEKFNNDDFNSKNKISVDSNSSQEKPAASVSHLSFAGRVLVKFLGLKK